MNQSICSRLAHTIIAIAVLTTTQVVVTQSVAAQTQTTPQLSWISPWVDDVSEFEVRITPGSAPLDTQLTSTVYERVDGTTPQLRSRIAEQVAGKKLGTILSGPKRRLAFSAVTAAGEIDLKIPLRSSSSSGDDTRLTLSSAGLYPVRLELADNQGQLIWEQTVYIVRMVKSKPSRQVIMAPILRTAARPIVDPASLGRTAEEVSEPIRALRAHLERLNTLAVTASLDTSLAAAARSSGAETVIDDLHAALATTTLARSSYVPVDISAWTQTNGVSTLGILDTADRAELVKTLPNSAVDRLVWIADETFGPDSAPLLETIGANRFVLERNHIESPNTSSLDDLLGHPFELRAGDQSKHQAILRDWGVEQALNNADRAGETAAHDALVQLATLSFGSKTSTGVAVDFSQVAPATESALAEMLRSNPPLTFLNVAHVGDVFDQLPSATISRNRQPIPAEASIAAPSSVADVTGLQKSFEGLWQRVSQFSATLGPLNDAPTRQRELLLESLNRSLDPNLRTSMYDRISAELDFRNQQISMDPDRSIRVTSRQAELPLRINNDDDIERFVEVRLQAPPLIQFDQDTQLVTLAPGQNRINVPITVRSSGEFLIRVEVRSPSGPIITSSRQRVRSTAVSGVGIILSGGALIVLVAWWFRTLKRTSKHAHSSPSRKPRR